MGGVEGVLCVWVPCSNQGRQGRSSLFLPFQVRELCLKLLASYPSMSFVILVLRTLTMLSVATLVDVSAQVMIALPVASIS